MYYYETNLQETVLHDTYMENMPYNNNAFSILERISELYKY